MALLSKEYLQKCLTIFNFSALLYQLGAAASISVFIYIYFKTGKISLIMIILSGVNLVIHLMYVLRAISIERILNRK